ncbi:MAG: metal-dependent hydrolase [Sandaracinaceae bacterium]|nr:metal-dependent hydrolase [Sandaracinaceae bacterium]
MDNVTHTLAGIVVAEAALELRRRRTGREASPALTRAAWLASALGNNVPDLDFVYAGIIERPLGYLLHHRGHTHTLLLAPLLALLPFAVALWLERRGRAREAASDASAKRADASAERSVQWLLFALSLLGCATHLAMDATNNYGVHPFWPLDARWYFGDTMFIVEPLWWVGLAAPLVFTAKSRLGRVLLAAPPIAAIALAITSGMVLPPFVAVLGALAPALIYASWRLRRTERAWLALSLGLTIPVVFAAFGAIARARADEVLAQAFPDETFHDVVLTPMPGNPVCWSGLSIGTDETTLRYRRFAVSTWPSAMSGEGCHTDPPRETSAPRTPIAEGSTVDVWLHDTLEVPLDRLRTLAHDDCRVAAYVLFSRAPFVVEGYEARLLGDARYDMSRDLSWSKMLLPEEHECPGWLPGWEPPRRELLAP